MNRAIVYTLLYGIHGGLLIFKLPISVYHLLRAIIPNGFGILEGDFAAFGSIDQRFRSWYRKIADDYHRRGRYGFAFDDGLGIPLGPRIYNNAATYRLLRVFGARRMACLGLLAFLLVFFVLETIKFGFPIAVIAGIMLLGSPLLIISYTHLGKPEVFWWFAPPIILFFSLNSQFVVAGAIWSFLAFVSLPVAVMTVILMGPSILSLAWPVELGGLFISVAPGITKLGVRGLYMARKGLLASLVSEQARLWKRPWWPTVPELVWIVPFITTVIVAGSSEMNPLPLVLLALAGPAAMWLNYRIIYINDPVSFHLGLWTAAFVIAASTSSFWGLCLSLLMAYNTPTFCGFLNTPLDDPGATRFERIGHIALRNFQKFPDLAPRSYLRPIEMMRFWDHIPNMSRFLAEADGDPRTGSSFRSFWCWTDEFLPYRDVDLANEMYTRLVEPDLADRYLSRFNGQEMTSVEMAQIGDALGASYVVSHTSVTNDALRSGGYTAVGSVDLGSLPEFREELQMLPFTLTLFRRDALVSVIEPPIPFEIDRNTVRWEAEAGVDYHIKYRFSPEFRAVQSGVEVRITPYNPVSGVGTKFMSVRAPDNGMMELTFKASKIL